MAAKERRDYLIIVNYYDLDDPYESLCQILEEHYNRISCLIEDGVEEDVSPLILVEPLEAYIRELSAFLNLLQKSYNKKSHNKQDS